MSNTRLVAIAISALLSAGLCTGPTAAAFASPTATIAVPCDAADLSSAVSGAAPGTALVLPRGCTYDLIAGLTVSTDLQIIGNGYTIEPGLLGAHFSLITVSSIFLFLISVSFLDNATSAGVGGPISNVGGEVTVI